MSGCWDPPRGGNICWASLGAEAEKLHGRLRAPVGLDIGGRTPESIALSIVSEVHAALAGHTGQPYSEALKSVHASPMTRAA